MKSSAVLVLVALQGIFAVGWVIADNVSPTTRPTDGPAPATPQPDVRKLQDRAMDCKTALARAQDDCIRRLEKSDQYQAAAADLELVQKELDDASDPDCRAKAASARIAAKEHLEAMKTQALASDRTVAAAATAQREALDAYQTAIMQDSAAATLTQTKSNLRSQESDDDEAVKEMLERGETQRLADMKSLLAEIRQLDGQLVKLPDSSNYDTQRNEISQAIVKDRQLISQCQRLKGHYLPDLEMKVGSTGTIYGALHVFQVIDGNDVLLSFGENSVCWAKGFDTSGLVDDQEFEFHRPLRVTGTTQYATAAGSTRTVFVLEPFGQQNP
ncbi:MAG: hypothetical protein ABSB74_21305 [Tepidisphaeraceae bacterium]